MTDMDHELRDALTRIAPAVDVDAAWHEVSRRRRRVRRVRASLASVGALVVAIVVAVVFATARGSTTRSGRIVTSPSSVTTTVPKSAPPVVNPASIAYVSDIGGTRLMLAGPGNGSPRQLAPAATCCVQWSNTGNWLALQRDSALWVVRGDSSALHAIAPSVDAWAWSYEDDSLAVIEHGALRIMQAGDGAVRDIPAQGPVTDVMWSPDGLHLAFAGAVNRSGPPQTRHQRLFVVDTVPPGRECRQGCPGPPVEVPFTTDPNQWPVALYLAGWSPDGQTLLVWLDPNGSGSVAMDGLQLVAIHRRDGSVTPLAKTLVKRAWVQWAPDGEHVWLVADASHALDDMPRTASSHRVIEECSVTTGACSVRADLAGTALDPALSLQRVAYVAAPRQSAEIGPGSNRQNYAQRELWVAELDGSHARSIPEAGRGIADPVWLDYGRTLSYVRDDALWIIDVDHPNPIRIGPVGNATGPPPEEAYESTDLSRANATGYSDLIAVKR